jgi:hypothetical protein
MMSAYALRLAQWPMVIANIATPPLSGLSAVAARKIEGLTSSLFPNFKAYKSTLPSTVLSSRLRTNGSANPGVPDDKAH